MCREVVAPHLRTLVRRRCASSRWSQKGLKIGSKWKNILVTRHVFLKEPSFLLLVLSAPRTEPGRTEDVNVLKHRGQSWGRCIIMKRSYHFPLGFEARSTQAKWNHSIGHWGKTNGDIVRNRSQNRAVRLVPTARGTLTSGLSHPIISPYDTWWHRQYVGSLGSTGMSKTSDGCIGRRASLTSGLEVQRKTHC